MFYLLLDFTFFAKVKPTVRDYGIIFSKDKLGDGENQFRFVLNVDLTLSLIGLGTTFYDHEGWFYYIIFVF